MNEAIHEEAYDEREAYYSLYSETLSEHVHAGASQSDARTLAHQKAARVFPEVHAEIQDEVAKRRAAAGSTKSTVVIDEDDVPY